MLNLPRDKKNSRREPGRDGKILGDHRQRMATLPQYVCMVITHYI